MPLQGNSPVAPGSQIREPDEPSAGRAEGRQDPVATASGLVTSPSGQARKHDRRAALRAALADLPERYERVIRWHHQERRSFEAIAGALGVSSEATQKIWGRALLRLRKTLGPGHDFR